MKKYFAKLMLMPALATLVVGLGCKSSEANLPLNAGVNLAAIGATIQTDPKGNVIEMDLTAKPVGNGDLAAIARHPHLQTLWLTKTGVTDAGLADLQPLRQLRVLGLARTGITDAGLKHLASIKSLREIWIYPTKVSEEAVDELKVALPGVRVIY
jgi:hypothetical protein